jgi:hypothetical protein
MRFFCKSSNAPVNSGVNNNRINNFAAQMTTLEILKYRQTEKSEKFVTQIDPRSYSPGYLMRQIFPSSVRITATFREFRIY